MHLYECLQIKQFGTLLLVIVAEQNSKLEPRKSQECSESKITGTYYLLYAWKNEMPPAMNELSICVLP